MVQVDHISAEDLAWVMDALSIPGVRNRNLLPTITKKGRVGHLLLLDIDPAAETDVARFIVETIGSYGYHRIPTGHVFHRTISQRKEFRIRKGEKELACSICLKKRGGDETGYFAIESDDLFSLVRRIRDELGCALSPMELRRKIEETAKSARVGVQYIEL